MNRGILVTAYANLAKDVTYEDVKAAYDKYYDKEYFVRVLPKMYALKHAGLREATLLI